MREDKEITKERIVYDSVAIYGGITHNSMLPGPKLNKMFFFLMGYCVSAVILWPWWHI